MKLLSVEFALCLYKSTIQSCTKYCCPVWPGAPSCCLELLDKLQKRICRNVGPLLAVFFEPLAHRRNVATVSLFYRYYFGRCSSELSELVPLPYSRGRSTRYSDRLDDFQMLHGCLCQQFLSSHSKTQGFSVYRMFSFETALSHMNKFCLVNFPC